MKTIPFWLQRERIEHILNKASPMFSNIDDLFKIIFPRFPWAYIKNGIIVFCVAISREQVALWHSEVPEHALLRVERGLVPVLNRQLHPMVPV